MNLGFAELRRTRARFASIAGAVGFIVFLALILSALGDGLYLGQTGIYRASDTDLLVMTEESELLLERSSLDPALADEAAAVDGVSEVGLLAATRLVGTDAEGTDLQLTLVGAEGAAVPSDITEGQWPAAGTLEVVADEQMKRQGVDVGSVITVNGGPELTVVGFARDAGYGFATLWSSMGTLDQVRTEVRPELASLSGTVQAITVRTDGDPASVATGLATIDGVGVGTVDEAIAMIPGAEQQRTTLGAIVNTTFLVAAIVIGLFFALVTLEKRNQFAVLKAIGMSSRKLLGGVFLQAVVASVVGFVGGLILTRIVAAVIPAEIPALFLPSTAASVFVTTIITGAIGALLSFRRIIKIDPATALGGAA
jgi:putative ABC transport system permease protein